MIRKTAVPMTPLSSLDWQVTTSVRSWGFLRGFLGEISKEMLATLPEAVDLEEEKRLCVRIDLQPYSKLCAATVATGLSPQKLHWCSVLSKDHIASLPGLQSQLTRWKAW